MNEPEEGTMMLTTLELQRIVQEQGHTCMPDGHDTLVVPIFANGRTLGITATVSHDGTYLRWYLHLGSYSADRWEQAILMQRLMEENGDAGLVHYTANPEEMTIGAQVSMLIGGCGLTQAEVRHCLISLVCAADLLDDPDLGRLIQDNGHGATGGASGSVQAFSDLLSMSDLTDRYHRDGSPMYPEGEQA